MSSEGQAADYLRLGRQAASRAGRKALAPITAVRQLKADLARAEAALTDARSALNATRAELRDVTKQLHAAQLDRDTRRAPEEVERVIARVRAEHLSDLTAPALRDLALAAQDLETNHMTGVVVEAGTALGGSAMVLAAAKA
jgi:asparagine synthase (glutamine-hydrolysing)